MSFVTPNDFIGKYAIAKPFDGGNKLQEYIDYYERKYLIQLMGAELYTLFLAGYEDEDEIYVKLYDPFAFDSDLLDKPVISEGIEEMLKALIYAHYYREDLSTPTAAGKVKLQPEGGQLQNDDYNNSFKVYNEGIKTYKAIQQWIIENKADYPKYKGIYKGLTWYF